RARSAQPFFTSAPNLARAKFSQVLPHALCRRTDLRDGVAQLFLVDAQRFRPAAQFEVLTEIDTHPVLSRADAGVIGHSQSPGLMPDDGRGLCSRAIGGARTLGEGPRPIARVCAGRPRPLTPWRRCSA